MARSLTKAETPDRRFTKTEMLDELKTIFLFEADHIASGTGNDQATAFIGFQSDQYWKEDPSRVDLGRFIITSSFETAYDYAFRPSILDGFGTELLLDLNTFMLGTPRAGGQGGDGGETHEFMTADGKCQTVVDAMWARAKLELSDYRDDLTTRELALLANMSEGAVRNALSDKSENGLRAIPGSKPVAVVHEDALRWLSGRRGFVPSPKQLIEDRPLHEHIENLKTAEGLGNIISRLLWSVFGSPDQAPAKLGWSAEQMQAWRDGTYRFDVETAAMLAKALDVDVPMFVGKALEVTLRRDLPQSKGGER
jgi:hypothetical protein